jgi:hypothetical protein
MNYGEIIKKAWQITWKFKVLWIFGILAGCSSGQSGNFNFNNSFRNSGNNFTNPPTPNLPPGMMNGLYRFLNLFNDPTFIWKFVAIVLAVVCIIVIVEVFLSTMGRIGLIKGSAQADAGAEKLAFGALWKESLPYFWRIFWLSLLIGSPFLIVFLVLAAGIVVAMIPLANNTSNGSALLILLPVFCVFFCVIFILAIIVGFISIQAERAIILEDKSILDGLRRGWDVLTKNLGPILIVWLITFVIGIVVAIIVALPLLIVLGPFVIAFIANMNNVNFSLIPWLVGFVCILCIYAPISWLLNGIAMTYLQSLWTLTYIRLTQPKQEEPALESAPANA